MILNGFGKDGDCIRAWAVLKKMESAEVVPSVLSYNSLLESMYKSRDKFAVKKFLEKLPSPYILHRKILFDVLNEKIPTVMNAEHHVVTYLVEKMEKQNLKPHVPMYNMIMSLVGRTGDVKKTKSWFEKMQNSYIHKVHISVEKYIQFESIKNVCLSVNPISQNLKYNSKLEIRFRK